MMLRILATITIFRMLKHPMTALSSQKQNMMVNRLQSKNKTPTSGTRLATISEMAVGELRA